MSELCLLRYISFPYLRKLACSNSLSLLCLIHAQCTRYAWPVSFFVGYYAISWNVVLLRSDSDLLLDIDVGFFIAMISSDDILEWYVEVVGKLTCRAWAELWLYWLNARRNVLHQITRITQYPVGISSSLSCDRDSSKIVLPLCHGLHRQNLISLRDVADHCSGGC